jgi:hypothetical protein
LPSRDRRRADESDGGKGVAELRSSVIRVNSKIDSPARRRRKKAKKKIGAVGWKGDEQGTI